MLEAKTFAYGGFDLMPSAYTGMIAVNTDSAVFRLARRLRSYLEPGQIQPTFVTDRLVGRGKTRDLAPRSLNVFSSSFHISTNGTNVKVSVLRSRLILLAVSIHLHNCDGA